MSTLFQNTTIENRNIIAPENTYENSTGKEVFLNTYNEIQFFRLKDIPENTTDHLSYSQKINGETKKIHNIINGNSESEFLTPKSGINAEVLFYLALNQQNIETIPSSVIEDKKSGFDFYVSGMPVDITCSTYRETFMKKWSHGKYPTLYIPSSIDEKENPFYDIVAYQPTDTYAYNLIHNNEFNSKDFLEKTLSINSLIYKELLDKYNDKKTVLNENVFGRISPTVLRNQRILLEKLRTN